MTPRDLSVATQGRFLEGAVITTLELVISPCISTALASNCNLGSFVLGVCLDKHKLLLVKGEGFKRGNLTVKNKQELW